MVKNIHITQGLPASGKSTWAEEYKQSLNLKGIKCGIVNNDDIRDKLTKYAYSAGTFKWTPKFENEVQKEFQNLINNMMIDCDELILSNTYLNPKTVNKTLEFFKQNFPNVPVRMEDQFLSVPVNECLRRDRLRKKTGRAVGDEVILKMWSDYVLPNVKKPEIHSLFPFGIICDLDGTLAHLNGRSPYDASKCDVLDTPNQPVLEIMSTYLGVTPTHGLFTSGREEKDREPTMRFLLNTCHFKPEKFSLFMRTTGDSRHDDIVKRELYEANIKGKYNVSFVFEDRPVVVRLWKELGLPVFNVGNSVEF